MSGKSTILTQLYGLNASLQKSAKNNKVLGGIINSGKGLLRDYIHGQLERTFRDLTVMNGPFKGLKYPSFEANCSAVFPKLLGSYEAELHPIIEKWSAIDFKLILDVGCAEGYYAVGMAKQYPDGKIIAYDIDDEALANCRRLAETNSTLSNMEFRNACTPEELKGIDWSDGGLIICDCEGYEDDLFTQEVIPFLKNCHFLIETHDFARPGLTQRLKQRFLATHKVEVVRSVADPDKVSTYSYPELDTMSSLQKRYATAERRPEIMSWLLVSPK